jgi:hypothetical protein
MSTFPHPEVNMKLIKKSEKLLLDKIKLMEEAEEQNLLAESVTVPEAIVEEEPEYMDYEEFNYVPLSTHPLIQSVGNSGWQVSEIWKDVRIDSFS